MSYRSGLTLPVVFFFTCAWGLHNIHYQTFSQPAIFSSESNAFVRPTLWRILGKNLEPENNSNMAATSNFNISFGLKKTDLSKTDADVSPRKALHSRVIMG